MAIAKGSSNCSAARSFYIDTIRELINELQSAYSDSKTSLQKALDKHDQADDPHSRNQIQEELCNVDEKASRLQSLIFSGIYSMWEESLKEICSHFNLEICVKRPDAKDYLSVLFGDSSNRNILLMRHNAKELRNYIVHSSITESRRNDITTLVHEKPEWGVVEREGQFLFSSYHALQNILTFVREQLDEAEHKAIKLYNININNKRNEQRN